MYSVDCCPKGLVIGKQGENEVEKIAIDFSPWASEFGAGTISARLRRPKDSAAYPVALITEGTTATWTISATDTQYAGAGSLQLVYIVGDVVAKSVIWPVRVLPSLEAGEAPEPYESWLDTLEGLAADTQGNARDAAASAADAAQSATSAAASAQDAAESAASITGLTAVAETLPEGSEASASFDGATDTLTLGIPKGDTGAAGPKGDTGSAGADGFSPSASVTKQDGNIVITVTDKDGTTSETLEVDDALDETSVNPVQNQAIQNALWNLLPVDTASGAIASFPDGADDVPMLSLKAQIEPVQEGSGDPSPTNVRPISGHTGVQVEHTGVNLFDKNNVLDGYIDDADGGLKGIASYKSTDYIRVNGGSSYYVKSEQPSSMWGAWYDENKNFVSGVTNYANSVITAPSNATYVRLTIRSGAGGSTNTFAVNYPSTDHKYHAYQGESIPVSWESEAGTVYGGELDLVTGKLTVDRAMVTYDGSENWYAGAISGGVKYRNALDSLPNDIKTVANSSEVPGVVTNLFPAIPADTSWRGINGISMQTTYGWRIYCDAFNTSDIALWKAYLAEHPLTVAYKLATPITYHLTPQEVRTLLGTNNVWSDTGDTEVTYRADIGKYIEKKVNA